MQVLVQLLCLLTAIAMGRIWHCGAPCFYGFSGVVLLVSNCFGISLNMHRERGGLRFAPLAVVELIVVFV
eukprot:scaffold79208_cov38-Cyclotella_meneghiniana.AAC.3